jgi:hypothetical protein
MISAGTKPSSSSLINIKTRLVRALGMHCYRAWKPTLKNFARFWLVSHLVVDEMVQQLKIFFWPTPRASWLLRLLVRMILGANMLCAREAVGLCTESTRMQRFKTDFSFEFIEPPELIQTLVGGDVNEGRDSSTLEGNEHPSE